MCQEKLCYDSAEVERRFRALPERIQVAIYEHGMLGYPPTNEERKRALLVQKSWVVVAVEAATGLDLGALADGG